MKCDLFYLALWVSKAGFEIEPFNTVDSLYKHTAYKHNPHADPGPDQISMAQTHSPYKHKRSISIWVPVPTHAYKQRRLYVTS